MTNLDKERITDEEIAEILELDEKRTQGDWKEVYAIFADDPWIEIQLQEKVNGYHIKKLAIQSDYELIAKAPRMAEIIKQQQSDIQERDEQLENAFDRIKTLEGALRYFIEQHPNPEISHKDYRVNVVKKQQNKH